VQESVLGKEAFKKLFPVILTDGGSEFSAREEMEEFCDGTKSTTIFRCPFSMHKKIKTGCLWVHYTAKNFIYF